MLIISFLIYGINLTSIYIEITNTNLTLLDIYNIFVDTNTNNPHINIYQQIENNTCEYEENNTCEYKENIINNNISNVISNKILNIIYSLIIINSILAIGFIISMTIISIPYKIMKQDSLDIIEDFLLYEEKYDKEFYELEIIDLTDDKKNDLKDKHIKENTPNGKIVMYYNFDTNTFEYYFNNKTAIKYSELEAVAKLFTITYNCRILFIESETKPTATTATTITTTPATPTTTTSTNPPTNTIINNESLKDASGIAVEEKNSVFANVKMYNRLGNNVMKDEQNKKHNKYNYNKEDQKNQKSKTDNIERLDKTKKIGNHFKYLGKLSDLEEKLEEFLEEHLNKKSEPQEPQEPQEPHHSPNNPTVPIEPPKIRKQGSKIQPKNNISFAEYKKQILESNIIK